MPPSLLEPPVGAAAAAAVPFDVAVAPAAAAAAAVVAAAAGHSPRLSRVDAVLASLAAAADEDTRPAEVVAPGL